MTNIEQHHNMVKMSLSQFIKKNIPGANLKHVDQIVLEYVISILEEASQDDNFDVEGEMMTAFRWDQSAETAERFSSYPRMKLIRKFCSTAFQEMMSAYFSDFAKIDEAVICTWIFELENQLSKQNAPKDEEKPIISFEWVLIEFYTTSLISLIA